MSPSSSGRARVQYTLIRNVTSPEEQANGARCFIAVCPLSEVLKFDTLRNLRNYIPEHDPKKRNTVHKGIEATLKERPDRFIQYNGGLTISCSDIEVKDNEKVALVTNGSILNGAQTQGEIRRYLEGVSADAASEEKSDFPEVNTRVEFVVEPDDSQVTEIAIARNTSTEMKRLTMAGAREYFDELDQSFRKIHKSLQLTKKETDVGEEFVDTGKLLQILWLLCPSDLLNLGTRSIGEARLKSYKNRNYCLVDFENDVLNKNRPDGDKDKDPKAVERYKCFVDLAGVAWREYLRWQQHSAWSGKRLYGSKQIKRLKNGHVVADGVVFPILAAMSEFVKKDSKTGRWSIEVPNIFEDEAMIDAAREQLSDYNGNPMLMARSPGVYSALTLIPRGYKRMLEQRE
jgi:hypothetical protein